MASSPHTTRPARAAPEVMVGDDHVNDAMGDLRHKARILTLAIVGLIHSPHELEGHQAGPFTYDVDQDWKRDIESFAFDVERDLEQILNAMEGKS